MLRSAVKQNCDKRERLRWDNWRECGMMMVMGLDYGQLEEPDCRKLIGNVWNVLRNEYGVRESICGVPKILSGLLGVLWYGSLIGQKNGLILLLAAGNTLLSIGLMSAVRKKHAALHEQIGVYARETAYISRQSMDRRRW